MGPWADTTDDTAGRTGERVLLGRYRLGRRLGSGGFGTVWLATDEQLERQVAVKRIDVGDAAVAARAEREAKAAARLSHPSIVTLYEADHDEDAVYLVSELVEGRTLQALVAEGALSDRDVLRIGVALCDALLHAHGRGVVHRDVKPANVIVPDRHLEDGAGPPAKLTDFGIARLADEDAITHTGDVVGTLAYMAPEQAEGRGAGEPADLYALALVLYEALCGVNPIRGRTPAATVRRVGVRLPALERMRRDLPRELCAALDRAVAPDPADRGTVRDLKRALKAHVKEAGEARGTVDGSPLEPLTRAMDLQREAPLTPRTPVLVRRRLLAGVLAGALAAVVLSGAGPAPPLQPPLGAAAVAALVALLPRTGWLLSAGALVAWLAQAGRPGLALVLSAAVLPVAAGVRTRAAGWWSLPALAPLLGWIGLAGVYPALAGQARAWHERAALGALGAWWIVLAEALGRDRLLLGPAPDVEPRSAWAASAQDAAQVALGPSATLALVLVAATWAAAAVVLPLLVRGRNAVLDLVAAAVWATALATATDAVATGTGWAGEPRGLVAGAVLAAVVAVGSAAARPRPPARSQP